MELIPFNLVELMKTGTLLGEKLGNRANVKVTDFLESIPDNVTVIIDITKANIIDYIFFAEAIAPLFDILSNESQKNKYVILNIEPDQREDLLEGIMWHKFKERSKEETTKAFLAKGLFIKLYDSETKIVEFIGNLNDTEKKILELINDKVEIVENELNDIKSSIGVSLESLMECLKTLKKHFFIYDIEDKTENTVIYYSFYKLLRGDT